MDTDEVGNARATRSSSRSKWKQAFIRVFVLVLPVVIALDMAPREIPGIDFIQFYLTPVLRLTGLWQGEWSLFAPNPSINNGWVSAEIYGAPSASGGKSTTNDPLTWNSPYWNQASSWEKFYRFRHVNFYNRLPFREQAVADDFSEFIAGEMLGSTKFLPNTPLRKAGEAATGDIELAAERHHSDLELRLYHNNLSILMPEDGTLPRRGEETWMSVSRNLTIRQVHP